MMNKKLSIWLNEELQERSWSQSELARRAGLSGAQISDVIGERAEAGLKFYLGIAQAFRMSVPLVLEKAGIIVNYKDDPYLSELVALAQMLSPQDQQDILAYIRFRLNQENYVTPVNRRSANDLENVILAHLQGMDEEFQQTVLQTIRVWRMYEELKRGKPE